MREHDQNDGPTERDVPKLELETIERARETFAHNVAANVHAMLAHQRITVAELKSKLSEFPADGRRTFDPTLVDALLRAEDSERITCSFLADVAYALGFEWKFSVERIEGTDRAVPRDSNSGLGVET